MMTATTLIAEMLDVKPETLRRKIRNGRIKAIRLDGGPWRVTEEELGRFCGRMVEPSLSRRQCEAIYRRELAVQGWTPRPEHERL